MADLNSTIVRGNLRVTDDINTSGSMSAVSYTENGTLLSSKYAPYTHTHSYLPLSGGTLTGALLSSSYITLTGDSNSHLFIGNASGTGVQYNNDKTIRIFVNGASSGTLTLPTKTGTLATTGDIDDAIAAAITTTLNTPV